MIFTSTKLRSWSQKFWTARNGCNLFNLARRSGRWLQLLSKWKWRSLISSKCARIFGGSYLCRSAVICFGISHSRYCMLWLEMKPSAFFIIFNFLPSLTAFFNCALGTNDWDGRRLEVKVFFLCRDSEYFPSATLGSWRLQLFQKKMQLLPIVTRKKAFRSWIVAVFFPKTLK